MSLQRLLVILALVWIACLVVGGVLHVIRWLVYVAIVVTLALLVLRLATRGRSR